MSDTREKLSELLGYYLPPVDRSRCMPYVDGKCNGLCAECTAEQLISNGVTVQEWIPAKEPPEEYRDKYRELIPFLVCEEGTEYPFRAFYDGKTWGDGWCEVYPTHWMPFPEPPTDTSEDVIDIEQIEVE